MGWVNPNWHRTDLPTDPRLVVTDMDGTFLDGDGNVPDGAWELLTRLAERGVAFAAASGRQLASLERVFAGYQGEVSLVADNGAICVHRGEVLYSATLEPGGVERFVVAAREHAPRDQVALVWSVDGHNTLVETANPSFGPYIEQYNGAVRYVDDLLATAAPPLKLSLYHGAGLPSDLAGLLGSAALPNRAVTSTPNWLDTMHADVDKAAGVRALQQRLGVGPEQTVVFGDYLNDVGMMGAARYSFAVANAHADVLSVAASEAPSNLEGGVLTVLATLLER